MGFYNNLLVQCNKNEVSPSGVARAIGMSNAAATGWRNGKIPHDVTLLKLANFFSCTVDDLLAEDAKAPAAQGDRRSMEAQEKFKSLLLRQKKENRLPVAVGGFLCAATGFRPLRV